MARLGFFSESLAALVCPVVSRPQPTAKHETMHNAAINIPTVLFISYRPHSPENITITFCWP
jgi:hypothetical protein